MCFKGAEISGLALGCVEGVRIEIKGNFPE